MLTVEKPATAYCGGDDNRPIMKLYRIEQIIIWKQMSGFAPDDNQEKLFATIMRQLQLTQLFHRNIRPNATKPFTCKVIYSIDVATCCFEQQACLQPICRLTQKLFSV